MKIAIEGQRLFRKKKHGMDFVALELIKNLMKIDHENEYYIFVAPGEDWCLTETINFKIIVLYAPCYPIWEQIILPRAVKKYGCELLHCTSNTAPVFSPVPLVITLHDIIYLEGINFFRDQASWYQRFGNIYRKLVVPIVVRKGSKIITVSKFEEQRIRNHFKIPETSNLLSFIYNGVSRHFKRVTDKRVLEHVKLKYNLPEHFFFHLGNTDPKKNTFRVIQAFSNFIRETGKNIFLVMPDFEKEKLRRILKKIEHPELINRIRLTGYIINSDLPAFYTLCDIFLYPSLRESFGIPLLEAMRCGAPVITSNSSSMPEISGGAAALINPESYDEITNKMHVLSNNWYLIAKLRNHGLKRGTIFSWKRMAEQVLKNYEDVNAGITKYYCTNTG